MGNSSGIHKLYRPLQPAVGDQPSTRMRYQEFSPSRRLSPYIHCYWMLWSETGLDTPFAYRIVSDGCVDLLINCTQFEKMIIAGVSKRSSVVSLDGPIEYFGIRFLPGYFNLFFPLQLKEISGIMLPFEEVRAGDPYGFESRLFAAPSLKERITITEDFLIRRLADLNHTPDTRLMETLKAIYQTRGQLHIEQKSNRGISSRQLRRIFDRHIGVPPKTFARIVRFQSLLGVMVDTPRLESSQLCHDFGYYDQSHFIHDFKEFFGRPPLSL